MRVYAAGGSRGRELDFQIDQSGSMARQFDIAVNSPARPVALMLGAHEPTIWNIKWTPGSRIVAVFVSGERRQAVAGLDPAVPVLNSSRHNDGGCGYFVPYEKLNDRDNALSQQFFGKPADVFVPGNETGSIVLGEPLMPGPPLLTSSAVPPASFYDPSAPLAGQAGLKDAVAKGLLRRVTQADWDHWNAATAAHPNPNIPKWTRELTSYDGYVVLKAFTFPRGELRGWPVFFVPKGVPLPKNHPHSARIFDFNSLRIWWGSKELR
jgi:hypothetical protein